jgi:hypothetical protein
MNTKQLALPILILVMILAISGCGSGKSSTPTIPPTSINTPIPPAAVSTDTPIPTTALPTDTPIPPTPTITAMPGSKDPVVIGDFNLQISTVDLNDKGYKGMVPYPMTADQTVLAVEVSLLSGDFGNLSTLKVWVIDEQGNRTDSGTTLSVESKNQIVWLFPVPKTSHSFFLHFPNGEVIDLTPLFP